MRGNLSHLSSGTLRLSIKPSTGVVAAGDADLIVSTLARNAAVRQTWAIFFGVDEHTLARKRERRQKRKRRAREVVWNMQARRWRRQEVKERARAEKREMKAARRREKRRMRKTERRW